METSSSPSVHNLSRYPPPHSPPPQTSVLAQGSTESINYEPVPRSSPPEASVSTQADAALDRRFLRLLSRRSASRLSSASPSPKFGTGFLTDRSRRQPIATEAIPITSEGTFVGQHQPTAFESVDTFANASVAGGFPLRDQRHNHGRNGSTQFLIAHGRSRSVSTALLDDGHPLRHVSVYESTQEQMRGKTFLGGLIKPPVIRQFLHKGHLYKEEEERGLSCFELFADLVFVAIVRIFGEVAAEEASISNAVKFILVFWPSWSIWADMRAYLNVSGTDDAVQRTYILLSSILLIGYTAQAASIEIDMPNHGGANIPAVSAGEEVDGATTGSIGHRDLVGATLSADGYQALRAAAAFFLVAKAIRILQLITYALALPRFRPAHLIQAAFTLVPCLAFFRLFFVSEVKSAMETLIISVLLEVIGKYVAGILVHIGADRKTSEIFVPALEIGHVIEKTTAFFVLVCGEILMAVAYVAKGEEIGLRGEFARSALGVLLVFLICWVYFDCDSGKVFVHAIRRHWFSSISWTQLHLPLCASVVIVSSAIHKMIASNDVDQGLRWYFAIGMCVVMVCLGLMGFLHRSLDKPGTGLIPRMIRLSLRILLGAFFAVFPIFTNDSAILELGVYCAGLGALVLAETVGKIGTVGNIVEPALGHKSPSAMHMANSPYLSLDQDHSQYRSGGKNYRREDLTAYEKGEEDVGGVQTLGLMRAISVRRGQRTGLAAL